MKDTFSQMATLAGQMFVHVALAWWHRRGLSLGFAQGLEPRAAQGRPSPGCAPAPGAEFSLQQLFCCPGPAGTSWWVLQGVSKPHCGQPRPLLPGQCCLYPLPVVGSSPAPPPCHQHGHQPGLCPKTSLPLPQPLSSPRCPRCCRGVGWSQLNSTGSTRLSGEGPHKQGHTGTAGII